MCVYVSAMSKWYWETIEVACAVCVRQSYQFLRIDEEDKVEEDTVDDG